MVRTILTVLLAAAPAAAAEFSLERAGLEEVTVTVVAPAPAPARAGLPQPSILPEPEQQLSCSDKEGTLRLDGRVSRKGAMLTVFSKELYAGFGGDRELVWFNPAGGRQAPGPLRFESSDSNFYWFDLTLPKSVLAAPGSFAASLVIGFNDESRREVQLYCFSK